ncbi:unnamed protein product [Cochlearia groenlandica]
MFLSHCSSSLLSKFQNRVEICAVSWFPEPSEHCSKSENTQMRLSLCCLNGGGKIKPKTGQSQKKLIHSLEATYMNDIALTPDPYQNPIAKRLYDEWLEKPDSNKTKEYLHTPYHPVVLQLNNW